MNWQLTSVIVLVAAALSYLFWIAWRTWRGSKLGCNKGCACAPVQATPKSNGLIAPENIQFRQRQP